jgi:hypothetical protein
MSDRIGQKLAREKRVADAARAFPKGPTRKAVNAKKVRAEAKVKQEVRAHCMGRDGACRLRSLAHLQDTFPGTFSECSGFGEWAHFGGARRARTRGQSPAKRHNTAGSLMLCTFHHTAYDAGTLKIRALTDRGCDGPLEFRC